MRYVLCLLAAVFVCSAAAAAETGELTSKYIGRDFSQLLIPKSEFAGFIGRDYQRLKITFTSVNHDAKTPFLYRVIGYSEVRGVRHGFKGTITVTKLAAVTPMHYGVDDALIDAGIRAEGTLTGKYEFRENAKQKNAGVFAGTMRMDWYIDRNGTLLYDDIDIYSDGYRNNQYEGTWLSYRPGAEKKVANWGEYRIPNAGDLDVGAAAFAPNPKYKDRGWADFQFQK